MSEWRATKAGKAFVAIRWGSMMVLEVERRSGRLWIRRKLCFDGDFLIWHPKGARAANRAWLEPSMWQHYADQGIASFFGIYVSSYGASNLPDKADPTYCLIGASNRLD
jgi:hypothetical protein